MKQMKSNEGGLWTLTLFAANEIPSVVVTFVALIMFLQMGMGVAESTLFATILLLPWVIMPLMRKLVPPTGGDRMWLHLAETIMTVLMLTFALTMHWGKSWTVIMLMGISMLSAWHDMLARRYYKLRTTNAVDRTHHVLRTLSSHLATVLTYGLMIMAVGMLQIYFRQRGMAYSWSLGCYILAGVYMLLALANVLLLRGVGKHSATSFQPWPWQRQDWMLQTFVLMLMLIPQGLMFYSRTIYLLAKPDEGGLGSTLQEVGFAQGTIGVIAFLLGVALGRTAQYHWSEERMRWPLTLCLGLSPAVYLTMTQWEPISLWMLSGYTFMAQLLFGLGLNACRRYIENISGERYQNAANPLHIPVISMCIVLSMAASGFMMERMSFEHFFLIDTLCAPLAWVGILLCSVVSSRRSAKACSSSAAISSE